MTYGEWYVYWREALPVVNGVFRLPGRPPKRTGPKEACDYYNKKLAAAFEAAKLKKEKRATA